VRRPLSCCAGLAVHHKGMDLLVAALARVKAKTTSPVRVVLFGPPAPAVVAALGTAQVEMGLIADPLHLALVYSACDAFVAPSRLENLANTVLEAMACGTPCVAFSVGGMPDVIGHLESGYLARPFEVDDLAAGIGWALDHGAPGELRQRCRDTIEARFTLEHQAAAFLDLYSRIVAAR